MLKHQHRISKTVESKVGVSSRNWKSLTGEKNPFHLMSEVVVGREEMFKQALLPLFRKMNNEQALDDAISGLVRAQAVPEPDSALCSVCTVSKRYPDNSHPLYE